MDNVTFVRGHHTIKAGFYELIRGNSTTSDTFFAGRFEFLQLPGFILSPCLYEPAGVRIDDDGRGAVDDAAVGEFGTAVILRAGLRNPTYAFNRPFTAAYVQDTWQVRPNLTLNLGLRYDLDSQTSPAAYDQDEFRAALSFAWDPFTTTRRCVRGGFGIFYSPITRRSTTW